jgi:hypothetical protein
VASIDVDRTFELLPVVLEIVESAENPQRVSELVSILCCIFHQEKPHACFLQAKFIPGWGRAAAVCGCRWPWPRHTSPWLLQRRTCSHT